MLNRSGEMEVFARVVEAGSLTLAAHALHLSPSAVSKLLARLEARLGVTLMRRSARGLALTVEGERYYDRARSILKDIEEAEELATSRGAPKGLLRVNCNVPFAQHYLMPIVPEFLRLHPAITVDLSQSDRTVDLIQAQADVAIRTGHLGDTTLRAAQAAQLAPPRRGIAGLSGTSRPPRLTVTASSTQLPRLQPTAKSGCLAFSRTVRCRVQSLGGRDAQARQWRGGAPDGPRRRRDSSPVAFHIGPDIEAGRLIALLEEFNPGDQEPVQALFVDRAHLSDRIRVFIDFIAARVPDMAARRRQ